MEIETLLYHRHVSPGDVIQFLRCSSKGLCSANISRQT